MREREREREKERESERERGLPINLKQDQLGLAVFETMHAQILIGICRCLICVKYSGNNTNTDTTQASTILNG